MTLLLLSLLLCSLCLSFYFSGIEAGFLSLNREKFAADLREKHKRAQQLKPLVENVSLVLAITLLGNNLANISGVFLADRLWGRLLGEAAERYLPLFLIFSTVFFLIVSEVVPKLVYRAFSNPLLYFTQAGLKLSAVLFRPFIAILMGVAQLLSWMTKKKFSGSQQFGRELSKADFDRLVADGLDKGVFTREEGTIIQNFSSLSKTKVLEVMKPLVDLFIVHKNQALDAVMENLAAAQVDFVPVYEKRVDNLIGFVDLVRVFESNKRRKVAKDFLTKAIYVPEANTLEMVYHRFSETRVPLFIVVNEYGGCSGILTEKSVTGRIFGFEYEFERKAASPQLLKRKLVEIKKEGEKNEAKDAPPQKRVRIYEVDTAFDIDDLNKVLGVELQKRGFETLGGFMLSLFERVPEKGEERIYKGMRFRVLCASERSVDRVEITFSK